MYVDKCTACANGKTYTRYLLRESRREGKKTIKTTILNITPRADASTLQTAVVLGLGGC